MRRLVETRLGRMLVNDRDIYVGRSLIEYGDFSRGEVALFERAIRPGQTVLDVGANIGAHTLTFARLVGPTGLVVAFEPQRHQFQTLCANVALNDVRNVLAFQAALGDRDGFVGLRSLDLDAENNFGGVSLAQLEGGLKQVTIARLRMPAHFIKIDVEGMETEVIRGAEEMLRKRMPMLYVENDRPQHSAELLKMLRDMGYTPRWHVTPLFTEDNYRGRRDNCWDANYLSFNLLCVPEGVAGWEELTEATGTHEEFLAGMEEEERVAA